MTRFGLNLRNASTIPVTSSLDQSARVKQKSATLGATLTTAGRYFPYAPSTRNFLMYWPNCGFDDMARASDCACASDRTTTVSYSQGVQTRIQRLHT